MALDLGFTGGLGFTLDLGFTLGLGSPLGFSLELKHFTKSQDHFMSDKQKVQAKQELSRQNLPEDIDYVGRRQIKTFFPEFGSPKITHLPPGNSSLSGSSPPLSSNRSYQQHI